MSLLSLMGKMNQIKIYIIGLIVLGIQILLSDFLSLNGIRPDFILIFLLYISVQQGSFKGILIGFTFGIFADLIGVSTSFGLSPLTYTLTGYLLGLLCHHNKIHSQLQFHSIWICIIFFHFFCTTLKIMKNELKKEDLLLCNKFPGKIGISDVILWVIVLSIYLV